MAKKTPKSEISIFSNYCDDSFPFDEAKAYCIERHLEENPEDKDWTPSANEVWDEIYEQTEICWDDTKSESYKTEYIIPILSSCSNVNKEIEDLNLAIKRLENLGVKI